MSEASQADKRSRRLAVITSVSLVPKLAASVILCGVLYILTDRSLAMRWLKMRRSSNNASREENESNLNAFSLNLFAAAAAKTPDVALSPISLAAVTGLALAGATQNSETQSELTSAMRMPGGQTVLARALQAALDGEKSCGVKMVIGTSAWVADGVREEYQSAVAKIFGAHVQKLPEDAAEINDWVAQKTGGMISRVMDEIEAGTVALLVSAVYFQAAWTRAFAEEETVDGTFRGGDSDIPVKMMTREGAHWAYAEIGLSHTRGRAKASGGGALKLLEMPYGDAGRYSAVLGLPVFGSSVDDAIADIGNWDAWMGEMDKTRVLVARLAVPRFRIEYGVASMKGTLEEMGVRAAWGPPKVVNGKVEALFEQMTADPDVFLSDVLHKVVIEVSEKGTKAAAASVAVIKTRSLSPTNEIDMIVDKPFLFAIRDNLTKSVLFLARVDNPRRV